MIDANNYPSRDELEQAMRLENYISELKSIDVQLTSLECAFNFLKSRYEAQVQILNSIKETLKNKIDALEAIDVCN